MEQLSVYELMSNGVAAHSPSIDEDLSQKFFCKKSWLRQISL